MDKAYLRLIDLYEISLFTAKTLMGMKLHEAGDPAYAVIDEATLETPGLPRVMVAPAAGAVAAAEAYTAVPRFAAGLHAHGLEPLGSGRPAGGRRSARGGFTRGPGDLALDAV